MKGCELVRPARAWAHIWAHKSHPDFKNWMNTEVTLPESISYQGCFRITTTQAQLKNYRGTI